MEETLNHADRFKYRHQRTWGVLMFIPLMMTTFVVMPVSFLWDVLREFPRILRNLWNDLAASVRGHALWYNRMMTSVYMEVYGALRRKLDEDDPEKFIR